MGYYIKFPRDETRIIDLDNGSYSADTYPKMNVRVYQDIWLCLIFAVVEKDKNSTRKWLHPFNYLGKYILSIRDFKDILQAKIRRDKSITATGLGYWLEDPKEKGPL